MPQGASAALLLELEEFDVSMLLGDPLGHLVGAVRRSIVDKHKLPRIVESPGKKAAHRLDGLFQHVSLVEDGDHDVDGGRNSFGCGLRHLLNAARHPLRQRRRPYTVEYHRRQDEQEERRGSGYEVISVLPFHA